ncbi:type IV toxin-antitoxin system AbiEi family antitoxin [Isoptericola croceus]|uniref:type IV toxin-antitoxin system AbiEi family antitoxin n=1 Tax=Isoptericola croceus TaxID=3031406 RepID=UPI0023F96E8B|nr:type IV toxin-antitoxin system AbiEi family antitoxin [Isoptericola croceus]
MGALHALVERIAERWRDDGVQLSFDGPIAQIEVDGTSLTRRWWWIDAENPDHRRALRMSSSLEDVLLIGDRIPLSLAERARRHNGWYIDASGNAYVRAPGVHIDVRGRRTAAPAKPKSGLTNARETNLMSARRAQVIFCLFTWPDLVTMPMRTIAEASGVSHGVAHSTIKALTDEHYLLPGSASLTRQDELLDRWATAFPLGLGRSLELGQFVGEPDPQAWVAAGHDVYVSGEHVVDGLHGPNLTLYVGELEPALIARSRWRRPDAGRAANIVVRRTFWRELRSPLDDRGDAPAIHRAPALLVYADLLASREPRQREAARAMRGGLLEHSG